MRKKHRFMVACIAVVLVLGISLGVYASVKKNWISQAGEAYREYQNVDTKGVLAAYGGQEITEKNVNYTVKMNALYYPEEIAGMSLSEQRKKAIEDIAESMILLEEAENRGLTATEKEIEATIKSTIKAYEIPEGKKMIDEYCTAIGITFEEYLEIIAEQTPRIMARQKLREELGKAYCIEHGLEYTSVNPPEEMVKAVDQSVKEIFEAKRVEIEYYLDEKE